jgi:hypothetical protein
MRRKIALFILYSVLAPVTYAIGYSATHAVIVSDPGLFVSAVIWAIGAIPLLAAIRRIETLESEPEGPPADLTKFHTLNDRLR